ncbi:MAG: class I SAM-dependent methyltransferase [Desulfovibrio sp.]
MAKSYNLDAPLEELLDIAERKFGKIGFEVINVGGEEMRILQVTDMPAYIDKLMGNTKSGDSVDLPLWAKVWPTALLMGMYMMKGPVKSDGSLLEVGAGVGVCGLFAAKRGMDVTITDIEPDALLFSQINILKNGLQDKAKVAYCDYSETQLGEKFDYILGCEVVYQPAIYDALADCLMAHLKTDDHSEIILAMEERDTTELFFDKVKDKVQLMRTKMPLTGFTNQAGEVREAHVVRMKVENPA